MLDNSSTHGTADVKEWLAKNPRALPLHADERVVAEQVEGFFGILGKQSLGVAHFPSKVVLREHIDAYIAHWNRRPDSLHLDETRRFDHPLAEANA